MARGILEIDGRRIELTDEQVEELLKDNEHSMKKYFARRPITQCKNENSKYYCIVAQGNVEGYYETGHSFDNKVYNVANYCTDEKLMQQRALHEILDRLLWRFSMENDGDKIDWDNHFQLKYSICFNHEDKEFLIRNNTYSQYGKIYFHSYRIAERAIKEIIEPFMKEHPEFIW